MKNTNPFKINDRVKFSEESKGKDYLSFTISKIEGAFIYEHLKYIHGRHDTITRDNESKIHYSQLDLIKAYEQPPYIIKERIVKDMFYNKEYGDDRICVCGHPYYRHFDTYEEMYPCGCKYCSCHEFKEKK